jgi:hypothetical protein
LFRDPPGLKQPKSGPGTKTFKGVGKKNPGAYQGHHGSHCLNHRKSPFAPLHPPNDRAGAQSKRFRGQIPNRTGVMICCNRLSETGTGEVREVRILRPYFNGFARQGLIHHAGADRISAAFGMRYLHDLMRRWDAS